MAEARGRGDLLAVFVLVFAVAPVLFAGGLVLVSSDLLGVGGPEPKPPQGTLAYGGEREVGTATIGCWREKRRFLPDNSACVSSEVGVSLREPRLRVPRGERVEFVYGGASAPEGIRARAYRTDVPPNFNLADEQGGPPAKEGVHLGPLGFEERRLAVEQTGERARIPTRLPPGEYQFIVSVRVDDETVEGEAHYDFDLAVE